MRREVGGVWGRGLEREMVRDVWWVSSDRSEAQER